MSRLDKQFGGFTGMSGILIVVWVFCAFTPVFALPSNQRCLHEMAVKFVHLFSRHQLSMQTAIPLLGHEAHAEKQGKFWIGTSVGFLGDLVIRGEGMEDITDDAELRITGEAGLILENLESSFGQWEEVFSSKTSAVIFRIPSGDNGESTLVFVSLSTPKPGHLSPVLSLQLRRDLSTDPL